jgi:hypothetical protein
MFALPHKYGLLVLFGQILHRIEVNYDGHPKHILVSSLKVVITDPLDLGI